MKILVIIGALVLLGGGLFFMNQSSEPDPVNTQEAAEMKDTADMHNDEASAQHDMEEETMADDSAVLDASLETDTDLAVDPDAKVFSVNGTNFAFDVTEIRVKEGDTVTINFESQDGFHDWVVDEFDAATEKVRPGTPTSVTFVADKAGTYEYYCSVGSHRAQGMVGTLIVE